jgi:2-hydroxy-3-keto-5-methylthiopentenyl-1-phosphate phosphatase
MALVTASRNQLDRLLDEIDVDRGFATLLDVCAARGVPVHIVSDGFDYCIQRVLRRPDLNLVVRLNSSQIVSSSLRPDGRRWRATFEHPLEPCAHGCATCKPMAMERLNAVGAFTVFVGDGLSDRYAATCADVVFANDKLAAYCERASIPYVPFDMLEAVADGIERFLGAGPPLPRSISGKAFPPV